MIALTRPLASDKRGATIVEFAAVAPIMCLFIVGALDVAHTLYTRAVLQGVVQKAGRDSGLEGSGAAKLLTLDESVTEQVKSLTNEADVQITRRFFRTFSQAAAAQGEEYTDQNANGRCDNGEPFVDANNNNTYDRDGGDNGQGGAKDSVVYTVKVSYPRMVPLFSFIGVPDHVTLIASTILKNQPFGDQNVYGAAGVGNCPV